MNLASLALLYALVGLGCACVALARRRFADALLLAALWPLVGPFLLLAQAPADLVAPDQHEAAFLAALRRASGTPLASLLPDAATVRALADRLRVAAAKVTEIDALLARPDFDEAAAAARHAALAARDASETALSAAAMRLQNIRRLRALQRRFTRELEEVGELLGQLTMQAEVVRLAGAPDASTAELVRELVCRVEGLDAVLDDGPDPPGMAPGPARA